MTGAALPVVVLGGYLGAGKTTLVNHLLRWSGRRLAVLVNDFGELPIDADLIDGADGDVIALAGGCVCCSIGTDLLGALARVGARAPGVDAILVEASGVADPASLAATVSLAQGVVAARTVVVVDGPLVRTQATDPYVGDVVRAQLAAADLLVVNKSDLLVDGDLPRVHEWLGRAAPSAAVVDAVRCAIDPVAALRPMTGPRPPDPSRQIAPADDVFVSAAWTLAGTVDVDVLVAALADPGLGLERAKGFAETAAGRVTVELAGGHVTVAARPRSAAPGPPTGSLVVIGARASCRVERVARAIARSGAWQPIDHGRHDAGIVSDFTMPCR